jgi:hypothetical protein
VNETDCEPQSMAALLRQTDESELALRRERATGAGAERPAR